MKALLLGDFSPTVDNKHLFKAADIETLFEDTLTLFKGNDINFVNLECALTESEDEIKKFGPALKASPDTAKLMKQIGINCCGLSNNHFFDFGKKGALDSIKALDEVGIMHTGFGENYEDSRKNLVIESNGEKICIIAVCEHEYSYALENRMGSRPYDPYDTMKDIRDAKAENDRVIVMYHGGKEHCRYPSPRLLKVCRAMADNGADIILCQHSHCIGCYEEYNCCHILYGQGNFHFEKPSVATLPETWNGTLAVSYDTKLGNISFTPIVSNGMGGIRLASAEESEKILSELRERSCTLSNGEWKKGWQAFCESVRPSYEKVVSKAYNEASSERENHKFAHYLDCEALTEVWRELFPTANMTNEI